LPSFVKWFMEINIKFESQYTIDIIKGINSISDKGVKYLTTSKWK